VGNNVCFKSPVERVVEDSRTVERPIIHNKTATYRASYRTSSADVLVLVTSPDKTEIDAIKAVAGATEITGAQYMTDLPRYTD